LGAPQIERSHHVGENFMSNTQVTALLNDMPEKTRRLCEGPSEVAEDLNEDVLAMTRSSFPFGTLYVTPTRLIIELDDGGVDIVRYEDVRSFSLIEGKKKLIGGYSETLLATSLNNGQGTVGQGQGQGQGLQGGEWAVRTGRTILAAHKKYVLNH
jgi:hypothetical protein